MNNITKFQNKPIRKYHPPKRTSNKQFKVDLFPDWTKFLKINPIPEMLKVAAPSFKFLIYKTLLNINHQHKIFPKIKEDVFNQKSLKRFFYALKNDQSQILPELSSIQNEQELGLRFNQQILILHKIKDLGIDRSYPPVQREMDVLLDFQSENGQFPLLFHHHAHACWLLIKLGIAKNHKLDKGISWLIKQQRADGGWLHRTMISQNDNYEQTESCLWTTAAILQLLTSNKSSAKSINAKSACEFLLDRVQQKNSTKLFTAPSAWNHLAIGSGGESIFAGGSLKVLDSVVRCGYSLSDKRVKKMYRWLLDQQLPTGFFPRISGRLEIPDMMVTIRVLQIVKNINIKPGIG